MASAPDPVAEEEKKPRLSKGERLFNWLTYGGIAGVGTFFLTLVTAHWAKYGGGARGFAKAAKSLEKTGMGEHTVEHVLMTTATMQGGNITVIPVKFMEDRKPAIVEKLNHMLGEKDGFEQVEKEPKQTWGSLIKARLLFAWLPVFASFKGTAMLIGEDKFARFQNTFAEHVVCKPLGKPTHIAGQETKLFRYGKIAALDVFATTAAATLLFIGSRFFAGFKKNKSQNPPDDDPTAEPGAIPVTCPCHHADAVTPREKPQPSASHADAVRRQAATAAVVTSSL